MKKILVLSIFLLCAVIPVFSLEKQNSKTPQPILQSDDVFKNKADYYDDLDEEEEYQRELEQNRDVQSQLDNAFNPNEPNYGYEGAGGAS